MAELRESAPAERLGKFDAMVAELRQDARLDEARMRKALAALAGQLVELIWGPGAGDETVPTLDALLARYPELGGLADLPADLIVAEYRARLRLASGLDRAQFLAHFPGRADELRPLLEKAEEEERGDPALVIPGYGDPVRIGQGGMGVVYRAVEAITKRPVAIKVMLDGIFARPEFRRRFQREIEDQAALGTHPNLVAVYGAGVTDGHPYMVLEYMPGGSLFEALRARPGPRAPLDPKLAARLALGIAEGIHHAHLRRFIHRDLKPGNVLLAADESADPARPLLERCVPKVTDFGLAMRLDAGEDEQLSGKGDQLGTAAYMAPEQVEGRRDQIDPRTDVWAIGVILHELLTGRTPFEAKTFSELARKIVEVEPPKVRDANAAVPRDLGTIVDNCLAKDPAKRYASARALAEDLRLFLKDEPIKAREVGGLVERFDRLSRWSSRNRAAAGLLATAAVVVPLALGASAIVSYQFAKQAQAEAKRANAANDRAQASAALAYESLNDIVHTLDDPRLMSRGLGDFREKLARTIQPRLTEFLRQEGDARVRVLQAETLVRLSEVHTIQGQGGDALRALEEAEARLVRLEEDQRPAPSPEVRYYLALTRALHGAIMARAQGKLDEGFDLIADAAARLGALRDEGWGDSGDVQTRHAVCLNNMANIDMFRGNTAPAINRYREALAEIQALADESPNDCPSRTWLVKGRSNLGLILNLSGRQNEALQEHREAVRLAEGFVDRARAADREPTPEGREAWRLAAFDFREALGVALTNLGEQLFRLGRHDEAEAAFRRALLIYQFLADAVPNYREYSFSVAMTQSNLGAVLTEKGADSWDEARIRLNEAAEWYARALADNPGDTELADYIAANERRRAALEVRRARAGLVEADAVAATVAEVLKTFQDEEKPTTEHADALGLRADLHELAGRWEEAHADREAARVILQGLADEAPEGPLPALALARAEVRLAAALDRLGRRDEARPCRERALGRVEQVQAAGFDHPIVDQVRADCRPPDREE
jgi:tetratricopeptide (TPR) repeat protein